MSSRHPNDRDELQEAVFRFLADPETHKLSGPVERVDTANAVVFLAGADVYKLKRAVKFPFMDLSTLDKRREACEAEIAVNRPLAPDIYLSALPIVRQGQTFALGGDGEIVEWTVHMRRFDENATLDHVADREGVSDAIIDKLARAVRRSHARAPLRNEARNAHALETYIEQNSAAFAERPDLFNPPTARKVILDSRLAFATVRSILLCGRAKSAVLSFGSPTVPACWARCSLTPRTGLWASPTSSTPSCTGRWRTACRKLRRSLPNGSRVEDARSGSPSEGPA